MLKNNRGELCMVVMVVMLVVIVVGVGLIEGFDIYKAKPKTVDTIENPAKPEVPYTNYE